MGIFPTISIREGRSAGRLAFEHVCDPVQGLAHVRGRDIIVGHKADLAGTESAAQYVGLRKGGHQGGGVPRRIVHVELPWQNVEPLVRELDPAARDPRMGRPGWLSFERRCTVI